MAQRNPKLRPIVLSIAGYDPSSGAGVTADVKTIAAHGCYGVTCITALTVQSTRGVKRVDAIEGRLITETLEELANDMDIAAVKIGMLGSAEAARAVAAFLKRHRPRQVVLDPVIRSSSGAELLSKEALLVLKNRLLTMVSVITPNIDEAAALTGLRINNIEEMNAAALHLRAMGARNVIITGGHIDPPTDVISPESSADVIALKGKMVMSRSTHGTGCAFAAALACKLAQGQSLVAAARAAKQFVETALRNAPIMGRGISPVM
jgi:hydroxymethylpyrimidine/phosphomethylpyrimidine kinase